MPLKKDATCVGICKNSLYRHNNEKINDGNSQPQKHQKQTPSKPYVNPEQTHFCSKSRPKVNHKKAPKAGFSWGLLLCKVESHQYISTVPNKGKRKLYYVITFFFSECPCTRYVPNCNASCSKHCQHKLCNPINGFCLECIKSRSGDFCETELPAEGES